jgi:hypothetical protein
MAGKSDAARQKPRLPRGFSLGGGNVVELWRTIPDSNYEVSNLGQVRRAVDSKDGRWKAGNLLKTSLRNGYASVTLSPSSKHKLVHRLVASAFIGSCFGLHIHHLDGNKLNNQLDNLKIVTALQNCREYHQTLVTEPVLFVPVVPHIEYGAEAWRAFGSYEVSNSGYVRRSGNLLSVYIRPDGMRSVALSEQGVVKTWLVHQLVTRVWLGDIIPGEEVNHKDGDVSNNNVWNLEYITHKANQENMVMRGKSASGSRNGMAKLDQTKVDQIREMVRQGCSYKTISGKMSVCAQTVCNIVRGKTWARRDAS